MNPLASLIAQYGLKDKSVDEIVEALNAKTIKRPISRKVTYATLASVFGPEVISQVDQAFKQSGMEWIRMTLAGSGVDFSSDLAQEAITNLAAVGIITEQQAEQAKALGFEWVSLSEQAGIPSVTPEMVAEALRDGDQLQPDGVNVSLSAYAKLGSVNITLVSTPTVDGYPSGPSKIVPWTLGNPYPIEYEQLFSAIAQHLLGMVASN